ncbi:MAG: hypothetical protein LBH29_03415, partial [Elusimicrobiota bacterium]|nr:hypothetical protein [Elusimicrobiota bacterium]
MSDNIVVMIDSNGKTEKDKTTAFACPFLKGTTKTSAIAQPFELKNFRPNGRIEFLKCDGIKTAGEVGNSERNQCPARSSELKSPIPNRLQKFLNSAEPLKMQGDSGASQEVKSGAVARPLDSKSLLPFAQRSDSADRAWRLNKKEQNRQRLAARFCDT